MAWRDNPVAYLFSRFWRFSKGNRQYVLLYSLMFFAANIVSFIEPLILAKLLNTIQEQGVNSGNLWTLIGILSLFIFASIGFWMFHGPARVIEQRNAFLMRANYQKHLVDGTLRLPMKWHTEHHSGNTLDKIAIASNALFRFGSDSYEIIETFVRLITSYIAILYFNLHASYIVTLTFLVFMPVIFKFDSVSRKHRKELNKMHNKIAAKLYDYISNITTIVILRLESKALKEVMKKIMFPFRLTMKNIKINETKWFIVTLSATVTSFLVVGSYIYVNFNAGNAIMIGNISALMTYVGRVNRVFGRGARIWGNLVSQQASVENVEKITKEFRKRRHIKQANLKKWKELYIEDLNFSYVSEKSELHLRNIDFHIKNGEKIALIGESGSGKTTFLKLFRSLYEPKSAKVYLDNKELKHGLESIDSHITLIPQEPEIFTTTIKENITMGIPCPLNRVKKYTDMARFTKVVKRLPNGFQSSIMEKGVNLSGGEKQRLALARGLLAAEEKPIILMDEPTSSVDSKNEFDIYHTIFKKFKSKTILSSIHRLHLLPAFDQIYVFKKGRIVSKGSFKQLIVRSPAFRRMWEKYSRSRK